MANAVVYTLSLKDLLTGKLNEADAAANKLDGTMATLQSSINKVGTAIGISFGLKTIGDFAKSVIDAGSKVENATTGLTTMLKDSAASALVIQNTMDDATKTPFSFESLLDANKALISANVNADQARSTVLDLANAIAATGGGDAELQRMVVNLQQIRNVGKATALDIKQFAYAGINIYEVLAKATNQPIEKVRDMEVSYDLLTQALKRAHDQGGIYANGLENMAVNTSVRISNLGDAIFQLKVKMFNDMKPAIDALLSGLGSLIGSLRSLWDWGVRNQDIIKALSIGILATASAWGVYKIAQLGALAVTKMAVAWEAIQYASITVLGNGMLTASAVTKLWTGAQVMLNAAMTANPIGIIIVAIGALVAAVVYCYNKFSVFRAIMWGIWEFLKAFFEWMYIVPIKVLKAFGDMVIGALTLDIKRISNGFEEAKSVVFEGAKNLATSFNKGYNEGLADFAKSNSDVANAPKTIRSGGRAGAETPSTAANKETQKVTGNKSVSINIKIDNLIKEFQVKTVNMTEGAGKVKELVVQSLLSAVNDSQIVAGS